MSPAEQIGHLARWQEATQVSEALMRALKDEVVASGAGELNLNLYCGVIPKVPGLEWVLKLSVWRQDNLNTDDPLAATQQKAGGGWDYGIGADGKVRRQDGVEVPTIFNRQKIIGAYTGTDLWNACAAEFKQWLVWLRDCIGREREVGCSKIMLGR